MSTIEKARPASPERAVVTEADVLERAADLLEEFGWYQGGQFAVNAYGNSVDPADGSAVSFCLAGACARALGDFDGEYHKADEGMDFAYRHASFGAVGGVKWNDSPATSKADVVGHLRDAAARLREAQA